MRAATPALLRRTCCPAKNISPCPAFGASPNIALKDRLGTNMMRVKYASHQRSAAEEIPMLQRALPVRHPPIALGEIFGSREPPKARSLFPAFVDRSLRLLRWLGEFFAAGGALS
jgi:hypothetical protein